VRRGEVEEERFVPVRAQPRQRPLRERGADLLVAVQRVRRLRAGHRRTHHLLGKRLRRRLAAIDQRVRRIESDDAMILYPHERWMTVHDRDAEEMVEAQLQRAGLEIGVPIRAGLAAEAKMPLAEAHRRVALLPEDARHRGSCRVHDQRAGIHHRPPETAAERILARQQRVTRRRADRGRRMCVGEPPALGGEPVDVRRLHLRRAVAAHVAVAEIVREDEHDVGRNQFFAAHRHRQGGLAGEQAVLHEELVG
jgi:hypothetical protein